MRERTSYSQAEGCRFDCTRRPLLVTVPCCVAITNVLSFVTCRVGGPFRTWQVVLGLFGVGLLFRALPEGRGREPGTLCRMLVACVALIVVSSSFSYAISMR